MKTILPFNNFFFWILYCMNVLHSPEPIWKGTKGNRIAFRSQNHKREKLQKKFIYHFGIYER
jgi:hypothetical protein